MPRKTALIHLPASVSSVERRTLVMRGHKVMLDVDRFYRAGRGDAFQRPE
jgi:hypothetical protein